MSETMRYLIYGNVKMYVKFRFHGSKTVYGFKFRGTAGYECVSNVPIILHAIPFTSFNSETFVIKRLLRKIAL